jgi:uncharacterized cofD-like protein
MHFYKWLYPGMRVKRWFFLAFLGLVLIITGFTVIVNIGILSKIEDLIVKWVLSISEGRHNLYGLLLVAGGCIFMFFGIRQMLHSMLTTVAPETEGKLVDIVHRKSILKKGPKVVAIGGGTGLPALLRGVKQYTENITAIVTMADDGGSSGRLRDEWGILPPGDIRNCLVALADTEPLMERLFQHRFTDEPGLAGHNFGNLFIATMSAITGDFEEAVRESSKVLAVRGRVLPSTLDEVVLCAKCENGRVIEGESLIPTAGVPIERVYLNPDKAKPVAEAIEAIQEADIIVLGPGSLYTSILPNLLVDGIADSIRKAKGTKIYVCNIMTQPGETDGYTASKHLEALISHAGQGIVDYMVINNDIIPPKLVARYKKEGAEPVIGDIERIVEMGVEPIPLGLLNSGDLVRHDPAELGTAVMEIFLSDKRININGFLKTGLFESQYKMAK